MRLEALLVHQLLDLQDRVDDALRPRGAARDVDVHRDEPVDSLTDLTAVDYLNQGMPERFCVVYNLYSFKENVRTRVKAFVPEGDASIDSVSALWKSAPWAEREVWDLFGISFKGHPDLKRLLLPESYQGHPLRKDYPLTGKGERMDFPRYVP